MTTPSVLLLDVLRTGSVDHIDFLSQTVARFLQQLMDADAAQQIVTDLQHLHLDRCQQRNQSRMAECRQLARLLD
ncbi:hypothetical protein [Sulfobacillus thermosulfidooxidans]|uniref:hypothetical protein n=1 Tax=Sulfobacillus thermosulfidooxidans TaxID=28034 RepID=UPI0006B48D81|nr:hypothetical protein [Sulfobacillus thermosulfidooxidans]